MNINYYYQFNDSSKNKIFDDIDPDIEEHLEEISNREIRVNYIENVKISPIVFNRSWNTFVTDINDVKSNSEKYGISEYFEQTMQYSMGSNYIVPTRFPHETCITDKTGFMRSFLMTLPYLYRDLKNFGKFMMPFLMTSVYDLNDNIKLYQITGVSRALLGHLYFPDIKVDYAISDKVNGKSRGDIYFNKIEDLCNHIQLKSNIEFDYVDIIIGKELQRGHAKMFGKMKDIYYIEGIEFNKNNKNFYDKILSKDIVWKTIYELIINSNLNEEKDYLKLLDNIISETEVLI